MSYLFLGGLVAGAFLMGLACGIHANGAENLTKEEYAHCVQIIINDRDMMHMRDEAQMLINEIQDYAFDINKHFEHLSHDAQEIINKVLNNGADAGTY